MGRGKLRFVQITLDSVNDQLRPCPLTCGKALLFQRGLRLKNFLRAGWKAEPSSPRARERKMRHGAESRRRCEQIRICHAECAWPCGALIEMKVKTSRPRSLSSAKAGERGFTSRQAGFPLPRFRGGQASRE
jgi:hypothetical protein